MSHNDLYVLKMLFKIDPGSFEQQDPRSTLPASNIVTQYLTYFFTSKIFLVGLEQAAKRIH